jgi:hypothetical protein
MHYIKPWHCPRRRGVKGKSEREGEVGAALVETLEFYATHGDLLTGKPT